MCTCVDVCSYIKVTEQFPIVTSLLGIEPRSEGWHQVPLPIEPSPAQGCPTNLKFGTCGGSLFQSVLGARITGLCHYIIYLHTADYSQKTCKRMRTHTHICTCTHACANTPHDTHARAHMRAHIHTCVCTHTACMYAHTHAHTCTRKYTCTHVHSVTPFSDSDNSVTMASAPPFRSSSQSPTIEWMLNGQFSLAIWLYW